LPKAQLFHALTKAIKENSSLRIEMQGSPEKNYPGRNRVTAPMLVI